MFVIAGLGNPGNRYEKTRHNVGFQVIDRLAAQYGIEINRKKHRALCGTGTVEGYKVLLMKPQTYMNLSGESVREAIDFYKDMTLRIMCWGILKRKRKKGCRRHMTGQCRRRRGF